MQLTSIWQSEQLHSLPKHYASQYKDFVQYNAKDRIVIMAPSMLVVLILGFRIDLDQNSQHWRHWDHVS